jgi:Domain of unknown function (DUF1990)
MTTQRFEFEFSANVARWSRLFGINARTTWAEVRDGTLSIRFGPWSLTTPVDNVAGVEVTGPYRTWRVAGPAHLGLSDRGLTFATNDERGLCMSFREPVAGIEPTALLRHPNLTVTVSDLAGLARSLGFEITVPVAGRRDDERSGSVIGSVRALARWTTRRGSVDIERRTTDPSEFSLPDGARRDDQPIEDGVGGWFHRRYRVTVSDAAMSADDLMASIQRDPNVLVDENFSPFVKDVGAVGAMAVGDRFTVKIAGPWNGPVEVIDVGPHDFRLATLEDHMEAGIIEMRAHRHDTGGVRFEIESWARSGDHAANVVYDKLGVGRALQSEMWVSACEAAASLTGGRQHGPVALLDERIADDPALPD